MSDDKKTYYSIDPEDKLYCSKCNELMVKADCAFAYLDNEFPVEMPVCPVCGLVYVPEDLAIGKVLSVEKVLEDK
ncbi:MAG: hypothetical protein GX684_06640 [Ruminococcaceae bacterium]|nr:hypothetical protein [Oscillospiraceae bacterium]